MSFLGNSLQLLNKSSLKESIHLDLIVEFESGANFATLSIKKNSTVRKTLETISWSICHCFSFSIVVHRFFFLFVITPQSYSHIHMICAFLQALQGLPQFEWMVNWKRMVINYKKRKKRWDRLISQTLVCFRSGSRTEDPKNGEWSSWVLWAPDGMPSSGARGGWGRWEAGWKTQTF